MGTENNFYYKSNRLQQLRGFYYTAQFGSVSKAAKKMGLQQSAVSMQIKSLERDFENSLFSRKSQHLVLTDNGRLLYEIILPHIECIDSLPDRFRRRVVSRQSQYMKIAANQAAMHYLLPSLIGSCMKQFPGLEVSIATANRRQAYELLRCDEIQAFVGAIEEVPHECEFHPIVEHDIIIVARHGHPLITANEFKLENLASYPIVRCPKEFVTVPFFDEIVARYNIPIYVMLEDGNWEVMKSFVSYGDAFTIVSMICYDPERDKKLSVRSLKNFIPNLRYGILTKKHKYLTLPVRALIDYASEN